MYIVLYQFLELIMPLSSATCLSKGGWDSYDVNKIISECGSKFMTV